MHIWRPSNFWSKNQQFFPTKNMNFWNTFANIIAQKAYFDKPFTRKLNKGPRNRFHVSKTGLETFPGRSGRFPAGFWPEIDHFVDENVVPGKLAWSPNHGSKAGKLHITPQSISDYGGLWLFDIQMCLGPFFAKLQKRDFSAQFPLAFLQRIVRK